MTEIKAIKTEYRRSIQYLQTKGFLWPCEPVHGARPSKTSTSFSTPWTELRGSRIFVLTLTHAAKGQKGFHFEKQTAKLFLSENKF